MKAKKKKLDKLTPKDLGVDVTPSIETVSVAEPAKRSGGKKVESVDEVCDPLSMRCFNGVKQVFNEGNASYSCWIS